jgi:hypothetical protein
MEFDGGKPWPYRMVCSQVCAAIAFGQPCCDRVDDRALVVVGD